MKISRLASGALGVMTAVALLAGCSGGGAGSQYSPVSPVGGGTGMSGMSRAHVLDRHNTLASVKAIKVHSDHHKSWVSPDAKRAPRLLFVSDSAYNDVFIFTMPQMQLKGTLTGFSEPQGECADAAGNIWVTNTGAYQILQLSRTGQLLQTLSDPSGYPVGCAINKSNGDLAVTDIFGFSGAGGIELYHNASGSPTRITNSAQYEYYFDGYDNNGNLFVDGWNYPSFTFTISELPSGSSTMHTVGISGSEPFFPGMVQWYNHGSVLAVGDQLCGGTNAACVYWYSISGSTATETGVTNVNAYDGSGICDMVQAVIAANGQKYLAGGDYNYCGNTPPTVNRWAWPAGGNPTNYNNSVVSGPIGAAVSTKAVTLK